MTWARARVLPALRVLGSIRVGWRCSWLGWSLGRGCCYSGGILVALWLMLAVLDVAVGTEPSLGGPRVRAALLEGVSWGTVPICLACLGVHRFLQRALRPLWGHSGMVACTAVSPPQPWPPKLYLPPAPLLLALGMV